MFYLYILQNTNKSFYIGTTKDLQKRIHQHNSNQSKYTKNRGPWKLVYRELYSTRSEAMKREYFIKAQKSRNFIFSLIISQNNSDAIDIARPD